ncbi:hypothetical protein GPJ56_008288 [Histomonas meleagridis]|uniref:uncharacterized protein n=1 Tax=Histomonas meleagridis TaxID=135588 RepID=UPI00355AA4C1|nr:hypothetical protein GPJ56_008288 [Histomonas meleagridis]KAH0806858.1 hypothetical protein GO595_000034 [Histomonas meleagridis]
MSSFSPQKSPTRKHLSPSPKNTKSPSATLYIEKIRKENQLLTKQYQELENELTKLKIQNKELSEKSNQQKIDLSDPDLYKLDQQIQSLKKDFHYIQTEFEYAEYSLQEREADYVFLQDEINELQHNQTTDKDEQVLIELINSKLEEQQQNEQQLNVLQVEEREALENLRKREESLKIKDNNLPNPSQEYVNERNKMIEMHTSLTNRINQQTQANNSLEQQLKDLKANFFNGLHTSESEVKKSLFAEIELRKQQYITNLINAIQTEEEYKQMLDEELKELQKTTEVIEKFQERCYNHGKTSYQVVTNQTRIQMLQKQLEKLSIS